MGLGLLTTSCAGVIGAGAAALVVGAGVLSMTCYDRMLVTVTDQVTGLQLCDAKVTFTRDGSVTEATPCYTAALSTGKYQMRVERRGLVSYQQPIEVNTGSKCRHAAQTVYVALERPNAQKAPRPIGPPTPLPAPAPPAPPTEETPAPSIAPTPVPSGSAVPPPAATPAAPTPPATPAPPPTAPTPAATPASSAPAKAAFPDGAQ